VNTIKTSLIIIIISIKDLHLSRNNRSTGKSTCHTSMKNILRSKIRRISNSTNLDPWRKIWMGRICRILTKYLCMMACRRRKSSRWRRPILQRRRD